jgi:hypothetical protein
MICRSVGSRERRVRWDTDRMGRGMRILQITLIICYQIEHIQDLRAVSLRCAIG